MKKKFGLFLLVFTLLIPGCDKEPDFTKNSGTFKDSRDKHLYKWVRIGEQVWMSENLAYLPAVNPDSAGSESDPYYYVYDYEGSSISEAKSKVNYTTYGVLYNWEAAKTACPSGWHLPTDAEWKILETYLGLSQSDADSTYLRNSRSIGKKMKSTTDWAENCNGDNSSGFNALPGGNFNYDGGFFGLDTYADFGSASEYDATDFWLRTLLYDDGVYRYNYGKSNGFSVRCLKDIWVASSDLNPGLNSG